MQTILGSGGAIGIELAKALKSYTDDIKLVSRNPEKVNNSDLLFSANLFNYDEVLEAVKGSEIVYLTVGLPYKTSVWEKSWPLVMENVINACVANKAKLVFFDNIYMYDGSDLNPITESHPINPPSKKGRVRSNLNSMLEQAVSEYGLDVLIARAADFYGPGIKDVSLLTESVFKPLSLGKKANWLGSSTFKHSFTFTPDAGKATAILGNTPEAFGEVWHLPTAPDPLNGKQWIENIAKEMGVKPRFQVANKFMLRILGLFIPVMKEFVEMIYQYDRDYVFSSEKFEKRFQMKATPYLLGIQEIIEQDYSGNKRIKNGTK